MVRDTLVGSIITQGLGQRSSRFLTQSINVEKELCVS